MHPLVSAIMCGSAGSSLLALLNTTGISVSWPGTAALDMETNGESNPGFGSPVPEDWIIAAPITGIGNNFHVRAVKTSGTETLPTGWYALSSQVNAYSISVPATSDVSWIGDLEYSLDGGSTTVATCPFTLAAQYVAP